jgi:sulfide:quinone oxidoreductase
MNVLVAGGGVAALEAALALRELAGERTNLELLAPEPHFWYRPLAVAEPFRLGEVRRVELAELATAAGATYSPGTLVRVDVNRRLACTAASGDLPYDRLLIACGAVPRPAVPGALTFRGPADTDKIERLLGDIDDGRVHRVAFVVPWGAVWSLPAYELALLTAAHAEARGIDQCEVALVTPEEHPLQLFGRAASEAVQALLDERGIELHTRAYATEVRDGELGLVPDAALPADRVVALPRLYGPRIDGVPRTVDGFVPVDQHGLVSGLTEVFAAGDVTTFPVKQGGIAAQQADAAAEAIAEAAGAELEPQPFRPVLRGLLLTGAQPRYLRHEVTGGTGDTSAASVEPLWWPPAKIVGRHLAPFLASLAGSEPAPSVPPSPDAISVEVDLRGAAGHRLDARVTTTDETAPSVASVMVADPLVVAPEDTLGEAAETMRMHDVGSALVVDHGRLIGILTSRDLLGAFAGRVHPSEARIREWMTADPVTVSEETTREAAAMLMAEYGVYHLPVVRGERPVGVVGMRDVASAAPAQSALGG